MDLKIPPPIILIVALVLQLELAFYVPTNYAFISPIWVPFIWVVFGAIIALLGVNEFRINKTTVNPLKPEQASKLTTTGIYAYSRNPMYLGLAMISLGGVFYHGDPVTLIGVIFFVLYIDRFQIKPEEKIMSEKFSDDFEQYRQKVRRWV